MNCAELKKQNNKEKTKKDLIKCEQKKIKMEKYQEKLKSLGYDLEVIGCVDNKTIISHHKYLKFKKREERKKRKAERKKN